MAPPVVAAAPAPVAEPVVPPVVKPLPTGTVAESLNRFLTDEIEQALSTLPPRDAKVLRLYFGLEGGREHTLEEIGSMLGVTRERVRQLRDRALKRLKSKIETEGTLEEFRRRRQHETLTQRKKRKAKSAAKKKNQKYRFVP